MYLNTKEWPLLRLDNYQTRTQSPLFKQMRRDQLPLTMKKAACDGMPCAISKERSASSGPCGNPSRCWLFEPVAHSFARRPPWPSIRSVRS